MRKLKLTKNRMIISGITCMVVVLAIAWYVMTYVCSSHGNRIKRVHIGGESFLVEHVYSDEKMRDGLGERDSLCTRCGMAFVFKESGMYSFWMKGMRFPLDIVWIQDDTVVFMQKNISQDDQHIVTPSTVADSVLEVAAGTMDRQGVAIGDSVVIR